MTQEHPNIALMKQLEPSQTANKANLFAENFIWRFLILKLLTCLPKTSFGIF